MSQENSTLHRLKLQIQATQQQRKQLEKDRTEQGRLLSMLVLDAQNEGASLSQIREWTALSHQRVYAMIQQFLTQDEIKSYRERRNQ